jgi:hypothetical protein
LPQTRNGTGFIVHDVFVMCGELENVYEGDLPFMLNPVIQAEYYPPETGK